MPFWSGVLTLKLTVGADTYEYLTPNSVQDNGDGTGTALNTGNTGASFNGTVSNYDPATDLVTITNDSRSYPLNVDAAIQPNANNPGTDDATIINYDSGMAQ